MGRSGFRKSRRVWGLHALSRYGLSRYTLSSVALSLVLSLAVGGCASKRILEEHSDLKDKALFMLTPKEKLIKLQGPISQDEKFHAFLRISESFLNRAAGELMNAEVVPSRFESPVVVGIPPFGTQVTFRPAVEAKNPRLTFTGACDACLQLQSGFAGRLVVDVAGGAGGTVSRLFEGTALEGTLTLRGKLIPTYTGGVPSLSLQLEPPQDQDVVVSVKLPVPGADGVIASALRSQMRKALERPDLNTFSLLSFKELVLPDSKVVVNTLAYRIARQPAPELQLGVMFNLTSSPELSGGSFTQSLDPQDFGMSLGEGVLTDLLKVWLAEEYVPSTYNTSGDPDPKGKLTVDVRSFHVTDAGYETAARFWYTGSPPFWREYKLTGTMKAARGDVEISSSKAVMQGGEGPNRLVDLALFAAGVDLAKMLGQVGKKMPARISFPFGTPTRVEAQILLDKIVTENRRLSSLFKVQFVPSPTVKPKG